MKSFHLLWAKAHFKWAEKKWKSPVGRRIEIWNSFRKSWMPLTSGLKRRGSISMLSVLSSKAFISDGIVVYHAWRIGGLHIWKDTINSKGHVQLLQPCMLHLFFTEWSCIYKSPGGELACLQSRTFTSSKDLDHYETKGKTKKSLLNMLYIYIYILILIYTPIYI